MQRRTLFSAAFAAAASFSLPALADNFKEGTDYVRLSKPIASRKNNVIKVFSYDCPFCYRYDIGVDPKAIPMIEKMGMTFEPRHLETKGKYGRTASEFFAMCILRDQKAGRSLADHLALAAAEFDPFLAKTCSLVCVNIFLSGNRKERKTAAVQNLVNSWKSVYDVAKIQGIPAYVVNGKWLIMTKSIQSIDGFVALIQKLSKM